MRHLSQSGNIETIALEVFHNRYREVTVVVYFAWV